MTYKDLIFTDHARHRLRKRSIRKEAVYQTIHNSKKTFPAKQEATKFVKTINKRKHQVVAKRLNKENKWLVISLWVRGEEDQPELLWKILTFPFKLIWKLICYIFAKTSKIK